MIALKTKTKQTNKKNLYIYIFICISLHISLGGSERNPIFAQDAHNFSRL